MVNDPPSKQIALVLQGGGALGAYEVGVLKVLCKKLVQSKRSSNEEKDRPLFDIIAGSSMGAMNAAILVSNVVNRKKTWKDAVKELENFWIDEKNGLSSTPDFSNWWRDKSKKQKAFNASAEAARRYYSVKEYLEHGTPNVCSGPEPELDLKFADPDNTWFTHSSNPLQHTIERYSNNKNTKKLRIATSFDERQPRLLVISVDVAKGKTVAFDSYYKKGHSKNPVYDDDGITIDHIMASGTIPIFYKFREMGGRKFCDGGWLSNTPFRELLKAHLDYWVKVADEDTGEIPDLDVYIVNVHPSKADRAPTEYDEVKNRINDISFLDRNSHYDEMVTYLAADYNQLVDISRDFTELIDKLKDLAKTHFTNTGENDAFQKDFQHLLR
jgi:NTE family protein